MLDLRPMGDRAYLARFGDELEAQAWAEAVGKRGLDGILEVVVAYATAAVYLDPDRVVIADLEQALRSIRVDSEARPAGRLIRLPVLYDGEDLPEVAGRVGLSVEGVIQRHGSIDYSVYCLGFLPGFAYSGYLPEPLSGLARRESPRSKVPAGSVAIAGRQTGVYPQESPGGWHLLGRCPLRLVDVASGFFPIRPGDRLRFEPIDPEEFRSRQGEPVGLAE